MSMRMDWHSLHRQRNSTSGTSPVWRAEDLMRRHERAYRQVHRWLRRVIDAASIRGEQHSVFGWQRFAPEGFNPHSIRNWPCQTIGFEILMLAAHRTHLSGQLSAGASTRQHRHHSKPAPAQDRPAMSAKPTGWLA
jgi:hypothetical protein